MLDQISEYVLAHKINHNSIILNRYAVVVVQSLSRVQLFVMPWTAAGFPILHCLPELAQTHVRWISDATQPSHPLFPPSSLPSVFPRIRVFSNESALLIRWPNYWGFSFITSPSNEYSGLISFRIDWFDLLTVQGTLKSLLQYHSSKASVLWCSAFFTVQLSHLYMTTGKTIALNICTFVSKVISLLLVCCLGFSWFSFQGASTF